MIEVIVLALIPQFASPQIVTPDELFETRRWAAAKLEGTVEVAPPDARLVVVDNHDLMQKDGRLGRPMNLAGVRYRRGLFCHANSEVVVRLPGPGKAFEAVVGVDTNEQTSGGRGSVVFSVAVGDREAFRSDLVREGMPGLPVAVDLAGATGFTLKIGDGGDGIACDQADWADARATLADGGMVWLSDLPVEDAQRPAWTTEPVFSFTYDARPSAELLATWALERATRVLDDRRTEHVLTYTDPATGLAVRCVAVEYRDFPFVEWTLFLKNTGDQPTPILEDVQALDTVVRRFPWIEAEATDFVLHHFTGSPYSPADYEPHVTRLTAGTRKTITAAGGRPTNSDLCYFNVEWPGEGLTLGIGWPGQWAAHFTRDEGTALRLQVGEELTHFRLLPGEEVRTPLIALQFCKGDRMRWHNVWRRWMMAHNLPRPGGKLPPVPQFAACSSHQFGEMINANEENQKLFVDRYLAEGLKLDYWWMDAGWYVNESGWPNTGTWEVDTKRFPRGLRAITDHAHAKGVRSIVWFEPERVTPGTWLYEQHPEWLLGPDGQQKLLNLGNPEAREWLTEHVSRLIAEQGIDLYRNDFNIDPLGFWRANDSAQRQGITEIRYVEGYLAYWDELRRRFPAMLIDSCASGGRRNDLETLRRAVPLLRSDWLIEPVSQQGHSYGIAFWMPFYGTGTNATEPYAFRSHMCPHMTGCWDVRREDLDYDTIRRLVAQWQDVAPCYLGDYYPLTSYSLADDVWMAWQFDRPDLGRGMVQVFRRAESIYEAARLPLYGLEPDAEYKVTDLDEGSARRMTGRELMGDGVPVRVDRRPAAVLITYRRV